MEEFRQMMLQGCEELGIQLTDQQLEQFYTFYLDLVDKNKVMNLTAITDMKDAIEKHFLDSIAAVPVLSELEPFSEVIDVGTGAGFPGIPLAIIYPQKHFVLLDSLGKRISFVNEEAQKLGLKNCVGIHGRSEDLAHDPSYREHFDLCVSRAVANLSTLSEYCLGFIHNGGVFLPYKSGNLEEELNASKKAIFLLGGNTRKVKEFVIPGTEISRTLVVIDKCSTTPKTYPRKAGTPSRKPLS